MEQRAFFTSSWQLSCSSSVLWCLGWLAAACDSIQPLNLSEELLHYWSLMMYLCNSVSSDYVNLYLSLLNGQSFPNHLPNLLKTFWFTTALTPSFHLGSAGVFNTSSLSHPPHGNANIWLLAPGSIFEEPCWYILPDWFLPPLRWCFLKFVYWNGIETLTISHNICFSSIHKSCYPEKGGNKQFDHE